MERFQGTVRFNAFAHTHDSEFFITRSRGEEHSPIGLNFIASSATTMEQRNPGFTLYKLDREEMLPIQLEQYWLDIERANSEGHPTWELMYKFTEQYDLPDMSPNSLMDLALSIYDNSTVAENYGHLMSRNGWRSHKFDGCGKECRRELACTALWSTPFEVKDCEGRSGFDFIYDPGAAIVDFLTQWWLVREE